MIYSRLSMVVVTVVGLMSTGAVWGQSSFPQEPEAKAWNIAVSPRMNPNGDWVLLMRIEYLGAKTIEIPTGVLPWSWPYAVQVTAIEASSSGEQLVQSFPVADPPSGIVKVKPRQVLTGSVPLSARLPRLVNDVKSRPVVVFWTWKPSGFRRVGGWVEIPQQEAGRRKGNE